MQLKVYKRIVSFLYPPTCLLCGAPGLDALDLCTGCHADLPHNKHCCYRCALPLPSTAPPDTLCGACQRNPPAYDRCIAPFRYEGALPYMVTRLKFHARMNCARLLGKLLTDEIERLETARPALIIPVPLHQKRLSARGFNQALEIARIPAHRLGLPISIQGCSRRLDTAPQSGLEAKERRRNIRNAFELTVAPTVRHIALLDDVVTTGSTVAELAKILKRAGVERVDVWAVAKTV